MVPQPRRTLILLAALWTAASPAEAVFQKSQMDRIDTETRFDSEYFLDLLGFAPPLSWEDAWTDSSSSGAYRVGGASLDCCDLLIRQELKYRRTLVSGLDFSFRFSQSGDKDDSQVHHVLEFDKTLPGGFSGQIFGAPSPAKEDSDIGLGLAWSPPPVPGLRLAARRTWVDFVFNQRGSTSQSYTRKPLTDEARLDWTGAFGRFWTALEADHPLRKSLPDESRVYSYRRTTVRMGWRGRAAEVETFLEYAYEFQKEGNLRNPDPGGSSIDHRRHVHSVELRGLRALGARDSLEGGAVLLERAARSDFIHQPEIGVIYRRWELQPNARWRRRVSERLETAVGGMLALGENRRRFPAGIVPSIFDVTAEAKLDATVDFHFSGRGRIGLVANIDLDSPAHFWDGGGVRALFLF